MSSASMEIQERALDRHQETESRTNLKDLSRLNLSKIDKTLKLIELIKGRMTGRDRSDREDQEYRNFVETEYVQKANAFDAEIERMTAEMDGLRMKHKESSAKVVKSREYLGEMTKKEEAAISKRNAAENAHKTVRDEETEKVQQQQALSAKLEEKSEFLVRFQNELESMALDEKS